MSEPTDGGRQQPDPESGRDRKTDPAGVQDQSSADPGDPTQPVWSDPTAPMPPMPPTPPPPGAAHPDEPWSDPNPLAGPPSAPPSSNPYAQQPPPQQPYGQPPAPPYGSQPPAPPYGEQQQGYGQQYPTYGQSPYATGQGVPSNTSAIILTIVAALSTLSTCFIGIPSLVFGIMALTSNSTDPVGSRKKARTGWIIYAVNAGVVIALGIVAVIILAIASSNNATPANTGF